MMRGISPWARSEGLKVPDPIFKSSGYLFASKGEHKNSSGHKGFLDWLRQED